MSAESPTGSFSYTVFCPADTLSLNTAANTFFDKGVNKIYTGRIKKELSSTGTVQYITWAQMTDAQIINQKYLND